MSLQMVPLTPERVEDFFEFFDHVAFSRHPEWGCGCYCCFFHATDQAAWSQRTPEQNAAEARALILAGRMRGMLAYEGAKPVGWLHYDACANLPGTRLFYPELATEEPGSAALVCFTVAQGWRGQGVATQLLQAALEELKAGGFERVEAYPVLEDDSEEHNYLGPLALYRKFGFTEVKQTETHILVELWLA